MVPKFSPILRKLCVLLRSVRCQALHTANGTQLHFAKREEVNGAAASRIRWRRIENVNDTIEIRSHLSGIVLDGLQWQYIVNCHIF